MTNASLHSAPTWRWLLVFALAALVAHELHELVHTWAGRAICGAWGTRDFNVWTLARGCTAWLPTFLGPLFSWGVMWSGVALLASRRVQWRWTGVALVFAPNPLGRLLPALLGGGDESVVARRLLEGGAPWPRVAVVASACLFVVPPLVFAWRALPTRRRAAWFALLFVAGIVVTGPLLFVVGNGLLARGVLAAPGFGGAPLLIELVTALTVAALAWRWGDLRNSAPISPHARSFETRE